MPWSDYPLEAIEIPADHPSTGPYIYIGSGDPLAEAVGEDAAIVFHFGTHNSAFIIGVNDEGTPNDDGHLQILARSDQGLNVLSVVDLDYAPSLGDFMHVNFGGLTIGTVARLQGESVVIENLGNNGVISVRPYSVAGSNSEFNVQVGGSGPKELLVDENGVTINAPLLDANGHSFKRGENGSKFITFSTLTSTLTPVVFNTPFTTAPKVYTNINSNSGSTAQWHSRAVNVTTTGFSILVFAASAGSWSGIEVQWAAEEPT